MKCTVDRCQAPSVLGHHHCAKHADPRTRHQCTAYGCFRWSGNAWQPDLCKSCYVLDGSLDSDGEVVHVKRKTEEAQIVKRNHTRFRVPLEGAYGNGILGQKTSFGGFGGN